MAAARTALGFVETRGLIGVIEAADNAVKAASVQIIGFEQIGDGLVSVRFQGDVASVQAAVQAAVEAAGRVSTVMSHHVIPAPHDDLEPMLAPREAPPPGPQIPDKHTAFPSDPEQLRRLSVAELRRLVRQTPGVSLRGRQVSRANKTELIRELQRAQGLSE